MVSCLAAKCTNSRKERNAFLEVFLQIVVCVVQGTFADHAASFFVEAPAYVFYSLVEFFELALDAGFGFQEFCNFG